jgi:hypothetical protein
VEVLTNFTIPGVTATDNFCASNTLTIVRIPSVLRNDTLGTFPVKFIVTDCVGNSDSITRFIKIVKRSKPIINLLGANPLNLERFVPYQEPGYNVQDNYYTNLKNQVIVDASQVKHDAPGVYTVTYVVTDPSGNRSDVVTRTINVTNSNSSSVKESMFNANFSLYPSPSKGLVNLELLNSMTISGVEVYSSTGQLVMKLDSELQSKNTFDLSNQSNGLYFIRINTEKGIFSKSFIINK